MFRNKYFAATDVGLQRDNNEDAYSASSKQGLWVVADGMGGHAAGEVASAIVTETIMREVAAGKTLENAIRISHHDILNAANSGIGGVGMGSTVVALQSNAKHFKICWVGDSRAYMLAPSTESDKHMALRQLSTDHSYVQMLYQSGAITAAELDNHPEKNIITQCLGSVELSEVDVDQIHGEWHTNSRILLCSDGLNDVVKDQDIESILTENKDSRSAANALIRAALDAGGKDNVTVAVIDSPSSTQIWFEGLKSRITSQA